MQEQSASATISQRRLRSALVFYDPSRSNDTYARSCVGIDLSGSYTAIMELPRPCKAHGSDAAEMPSLSLPFASIQTARIAVNAWIKLRT